MQTIKENLSSLELFISNKLKDKVIEWRNTNYKCDCPTLEEALDYSFITDDVDIKSLRHLHKVQIDTLRFYRIVFSLIKVFKLEFRTPLLLEINQNGYQIIKRNKFL